MICPHCGYKDGWDPDEQTSIEGDLGEFYGISNAIFMLRRLSGDRYLKGCPSCNKVFMSN